MAKRISFLLLVLALVLSACGGSGGAANTPAAPAAGEPAADTQAAGSAAAAGRCGDSSRLSAELSFYNWSDYIDPAILTMFEEECGVHVVYDTFSSNEDLLAKLQLGAGGYDVIVPSDYMVAIMVQLGLLKNLDHANIPNLANIDNRFRDAPYDPGNVYSVPYQWGTTGIGYDEAVTEAAPDSLAVFFDPAQASQYRGKISLLNDAREVFGAALKYLGYSVNSTNEEEINAAKALIEGTKENIAVFDNDTFADLLVSGDVAVGLGWSGDYFQAIFSNPDRQLGYVIPKEGGVVWTDNLAIPASAPNSYTAEVFINYLLDPEIGAMISNYTYFSTPNRAAQEFLLDEVRNDPAINPPPEVLERLEFIRDVGETTLLYERLWTEIKSQ